MLKAVGVGAAIVAWCAGAPAWGATTPGWECIPTTAGSAVVSGGTGSQPSCGAGTTAVLAPTYVASGLGGKPTVEFSGVNVQIVDGTGSTDDTNGEGNLVLGYDEGPGTHTGSHDLILGEQQSYTGSGDIVGGIGNDAAGNEDLVGGTQNTVDSDASSVLGGSGNEVSGADSVVVGGQFNLASDPFSAVVGGCENLAGALATLAGSCSPAGDESILGGHQNATSSLFASAGGPAGVAGAAGPAGSAGQTGPAGGSGAPGPSGANGRIELVTCTVVRHGRASSKHCTAKLVSGTVSFKTS